MKVEHSITKAYSLLLTMDWDDIDKMTDWLDARLTLDSAPLPDQILDFYNVLMEMLEE